MKYVIIGDVHGRTQWKQIVEKENDVDKFIFLGDYFDPYDLTGNTALMDNFNEIMEFKMQNFDKVVLLIGNHDEHYISGNFSCREIYELRSSLKDIFKLAVKSNIIQLCYFIEPNVVCSHAGFTKTWLEDKNLNLDQTELNLHFRGCVVDEDVHFYYDFIYNKMWQDMSGDNVWQGPLWVRPRSLLQDMPENIIQVVGHTRIRKDTPQNPIEKGLLLADCLEHGEYYIYENNEFKYNKL